MGETWVCLAGVDNCVGGFIPDNPIEKQGRPPAFQRDQVAL